MNDATIQTSTTPRGFAKGAAEVRRRASTVGEAPASLAERAPGILERELDQCVRLRPLVDGFAGSADARTVRELGTPIVPAVAGGAP